MKQVGLTKFISPWNNLNHIHLSSSTTLKNHKGTNRKETAKAQVTNFVTTSTIHILSTHIFIVNCADKVAYRLCNMIHFNESEISRTTECEVCMCKKKTTFEKNDCKAIRSRIRSLWQRFTISFVISSLFFRTRTSSCDLVSFYSVFFQDRTLCGIVQQ